jgi:urease accessory protein
MFRGRAFVAAAALIAATDPVSAHTVIAGVSGFSGGALHPLLVPAHALALLALGLFAAQHPAPRRAAVIATFVSAQIVAMGLVALAFAFDRAGNAVLALAAASGLVVASGGIVPLPAAGLLAACLALAIQFDSVPALISRTDTLVALSGTAVGASAAMVVVACAAGMLRHGWQRIGMRIAGSWVAAATLLVLVLRLK